MKYTYLKNYKSHDGDRGTYRVQEAQRFSKPDASGERHGEIIASDLTREQAAKLVEKLNLHDELVAALRSTNCDTDHDGCLMADIGVEALQVCNSPGCKWLDMVQEVA